MGQPRFEMTISTRLIGYCSLGGETLKGDGIDAGAGLGFNRGAQLCFKCASDITRLMLAHEGRVSVLAQFKSDPVAYLTEHGVLDEKGRVRKELIEQPN